jgi:uncharacterized protein (DUF305 family)
MKRTGVKSLAGLCLLVLLAVGFGMGTSKAQQQQVSSAVIPFISQNDVAFIDAIVPHHEMAVRMADIELQKGTRPEVKAMAQMMKDMQTQEIAVLRGARQALTGAATGAQMLMDPHMEADHMQLEGASGAEVDRLFLEHMIPHHAEGISLAHRALPNLQRADVRQIATNIVDSQAKEIGDMHELKGQAAPQQ